MSAKKGDTVSVHYTGTLEDGTVFDDSTDRDPLQFTIGEGSIISGFENAVIGMTEGESKTCTIIAADAYGPQRAENILEVPREEIPDDLALEVSATLAIRSQTGEVTPVVVTAISESTVTLDANHPLAGKDLTFQIQLVEQVSG